MKSIIAIFILVWLTGIQSGCMISKPRYPAQWPKPLTDQNPEAFKGVYASAVLEVLDQYYSQIQKDSVIHSSIALSVTPDLKFQIDSIFNQSPMNDTLLHKLYPRNFPNQKIRIKLHQSGIYIVYREKSSGKAGNPLFGFTKTFNIFSKLEDGSLLIKSTNWAFGLVFMFLPIYMNEHTWFKIDTNTVSVVKKNSKD